MENQLIGEYATILCCEISPNGRKSLRHIFVIEEFLSNYQTFRVSLNDEVIREFSNLGYALKFYNQLGY